MRLADIAAGFGAMWMAAPAIGAEAVTYRLFGDAVGIIDGVGFTAPIVLIGTRQTPLFEPVPGGVWKDAMLPSTSLYIGNSFYRIADMGNVEFAATSLGYGFGGQFWRDNWISVSSPALAGYDGTSDIGVVPVTVGYAGIYVETNKGNVTIGRLSNAFFWATAAVPEPATWAMLIVGFGLVGAVMRRRARIDGRSNPVRS